MAAEIPDYRKVVRENARTLLELAQEEFQTGMSGNACVGFQREKNWDDSKVRLYMKQWMARIQSKLEMLIESDDSLRGLSVECSESWDRHSNRYEMDLMWGWDVCYVNPFDILIDEELPATVNEDAEWENEALAAVEAAGAE